MDGITSEFYKEVNPENKNIEWFDRMVTFIRRDWRPLVNPDANRVNKEFLFSSQPMDETLSMFKADGEFRKSKKIVPLPILENIKNLLVEEITKAPPKAELKATDSTAINDRKIDMFRLKNRAKLEGAINANRQAIGVPAYKMPYDKFNGNVEEFDKMGLDETDPDDINFFDGSYHRLDAEIAGQLVVNNIMNLNRFDEEDIENFVIDILADKVICMQVYVDKITGEIKHDYLYPETFRGIFGKRSDGSDDIANGYEKNSTIMEWLQKVGNAFDFERDWRQVLAAINFRSNNNFTGFRRNNAMYETFGSPEDMMKCNCVDSQCSNLLEWSLSYTYEVYIGYVESKSPEITGSYKKRKGDRNFVEMVSPGYVLSEQEVTEGYDLETYYQLQMYGSYFLATSSVTQYLYGFGKVYYQQMTGSNDEYCSGTLWYYRRRGKSAVELSMPYLKLANDAFYKMLWAVYEAHPDWDVYQVEELAELTKVMFKQASSASGNVSGVQEQLKSIITFFRSNLLKLRITPRVDGKPSQNMNQTPSTEKRGLDPIAIAMQSVCTWAEQQIKDKLGINDIRTGNIDNAREGYHQGEIETEKSMNNTGYIYRMIQYMKQRIATTDLMIAQDIVKFKDSVPYKYLKTLLGDEEFENLKGLEKFAMHRFGLFVKDINTNAERDRIMQAANMALQKGQLTFNQWWVVTSADVFEKAMKVIDFLTMKAARKAQKLQEQATAQEQQHEKDLEGLRMQTEQAKGQLAIEKEKVVADAMKYVADRQYAGKMDSTSLRENNAPVKQEAKTESTKEIATHKADLKQQEALN